MPRATATRKPPGQASATFPDCPHCGAEGRQAVLGRLSRLVVCRCPVCRRRFYVEEAAYGPDPRPRAKRD